MAGEFYKQKKVFVTGGAGFIGHQLLDALIARGAVVTAGDNLSTGAVENILRVWKKHGLKYKKSSSGYVAEGGHAFVLADFQELRDTAKLLKNQEIIFHLAANFGGRGYIDTHPADCCEGFAINQNVIKAAHSAGVERVLFASSACVYPTSLQNSYTSEYLLKESDAFRKNSAEADREYGWAKLMGELTLQAYNRQYGLKGAVTRYVTAYGPWENDSHAVIALIRRAVNREDPFVIWGSGKQDRDFTYVEDIVEGTLRACEIITDGSAVNLGTGVRYTMKETVDIIFNLLKWKPDKIIYDRTKPEGVKTRALDISLASRKLKWKPRYDFKTGLKKTIEWFINENPSPVETLK